MFIIGLMSGTSADGTEAALLEINGTSPKLNWKLHQHISVPHPEKLQKQILECCDPQTGSVDRICSLNFLLGKVFAQAVLQLCQAAAFLPSRVDLIASHGQTLWHIPEGGQASTLQVGEPAVLAEITGITTLSNFRTRDMAAGGQGAPLVPLADSLLFGHPEKTRICQNIGGIANLTFLPPTHKKSPQIFAFDTGPGNMLIDQAVRRQTGGKQQFDRDGQQAAQGSVNKNLLNTWVENEPYFLQKPPKTSGREKFGPDYEKKLWLQAKKAGLDFKDYLATLTALTAATILTSIKRLCPTLPDEFIVSGGGTQNPVLMEMLGKSLENITLYTSDDFGLKSAAKEAAAFAILAYETWHNRPGNLPAATGAAHPVVLGSITPGDNYRKIISEGHFF